MANLTLTKSYSVTDLLHAMAVAQEAQAELDRVMSAFAAQTPAAA